VILHGGLEPGLIDVEVLLPGDVAGDFERQTVRGIEVKGLLPVQGTLFVFPQIVQHPLQVRRPRFNRSGKAGFLASEIVENGLAVGNQLWVEISIGRNDGFRHPGQERLSQSQGRPESGRTPDDHPANIVTSGVSGNNPVCNEKGCRPTVVRDHAVWGEMRVHLLIAFPGQILDNLQGTSEEVDFVV
jgi:hypothetical protein